MLGRIMPEHSGGNLRNVCGTRCGTHNLPHRDSSCLGLREVCVKLIASSSTRSATCFDTQTESCANMHASRYTSWFAEEKVRTQYAWPHTFMYTSIWRVSPNVSFVAVRNAFLLPSRWCIWFTRARTCPGTRQFNAGKDVSSAPVRNAWLYAWCDTDEFVLHRNDIESPIYSRLYILITLYMCCGMIMRRHIYMSSGYAEISNRSIVDDVFNMCKYRWWFRHPYIHQARPSINQNRCV